jgi:hypothetical protein
MRILGRSLVGWLHSWSNRRASRELFPSNKFLGFLFTAKPWLIFVLISTCNLLILAVPSMILGIASITTSIGPRAGENVGFMFRSNWGPTYVLFLPLGFALASLTSRSFKRSLLKLLKRPPTVSVLDGDSYKSYLRDFSIQMSDRTRYLLPICIALTFFLTLYDAHFNLRGYAISLLHHGAFSSDEFDWMNAAYIPRAFHPSHSISPWSNFAFYIVALVCQGFVICCALFWIVSFWIQSRVFADLMLMDGFPYRFIPWEEDPDHLLGLKAIGFVFSTFLVLSVLIQTGVYLHRVQIMNQPLISYFIEVAKSFKMLDRKNLSGTIVPAVGEWWTLNHLDRLNPGMIALLIASPILSVTIGWWPIVRLGRFIERYRSGLVLKYRIETQAAEADRDAARVALLNGKIVALEKACVWPNGYAVGWGAFGLLVALEISAVLPALLPLLVVSGAGLKLINAFLKHQPT